MNQTASDNAEEFGFHAGDLVQEWLWDDDVDDSIRAKIEELTGEELVDEDYDSAVDGVIIWWRDGDDEDELSDTIVDAYAVLGDDGPLWVLTPKPGRPGAASSSTVQSAAKTAGMNAATPLTVSGDWNGIRLYSFYLPWHAWPRSGAHIKAWNHTIPSLFLLAEAVEEDVSMKLSILTKVMTLLTRARDSWEYQKSRNGLFLRKQKVGYKGLEPPTSTV